jgi:hypothetical protein
MWTKVGITLLMTLLCAACAGGDSESFRSSGDQLTTDGDDPNESSECRKELSRSQQNTLKLDKDTTVSGGTDKDVDIPLGPDGVGEVAISGSAAMNTPRPNGVYVLYKDDSNRRRATSSGFSERFKGKANHTVRVTIHNDTKYNVKVTVQPLLGICKGEDYQKAADHWCGPNPPDCAAGHPAVDQTNTLQCCFSE